MYVLQMEITLKSNFVDMFYVDEPMVPLPSKDGSNRGELVSPSLRRYSYSRMPPVTWLEWCLKAYTGVTVSAADVEEYDLGAIPTNIDITGGSMSVSKWTKRSKHSIALPRLILVTAKGDPLQHGGLAFKDVYQQVVIQENVANEKDKGSSAIKHFHTNSGHCGFYFAEPTLFQQIMKEWYSEMHSVWQSKN